jgi:hypothetical protein
MHQEAAGLRAGPEVGSQAVVVAAMHQEAADLRAGPEVGSQAVVVAAGSTQAAVANQTRFPPHAGRNAPPSLRNIDGSRGGHLTRELDIAPADQRRRLSYS